MKRALILSSLIFAASRCANMVPPAAAKPSPLPAGVAQVSLFPNGEIYFTEADRPDGMREVEARVEGEHLWIDAVGADGNAVKLHRYIDPLPLNNLHAYTNIYYSRNSEATLQADGSEIDVLSNSHRGVVALRDGHTLGGFLSEVVNESLTNHDQSNVSVSPFPGTPLIGR
jgi:hypothetical protein